MIAIERIKQAEAGLEQSKLALFPTLTAGAEVDASNQTSTQAEPTGQLSLSSLWEVDIWGKLTAAKRSNIALMLQSKAFANAVRTQLIADIAGNYYLLLSLDKQFEITKSTVEIRKRDVQTMEALKESATVTGAAVVQSEANRYAAEVTLPDFRQNIHEVENNLSILLGRSPQSINRSTFDDQSVPEMIQTGVPAQLLSNRPDVIEAEMNFRYAFEITNVARTYFYPSFTISATEAITEKKLSDMFNPLTLVGNVIAGLTQPIFNQGVNTARLNIAESKQQEALLQFKKTLLAAGQEISNALFSYNIVFEKAELRSKQIEALTKSVDYTKELLNFGTANYTEVLTAEQSLLSAELSRVNDKLQQLQASVTLYRALGGGWK
jgi:NodT family efflux transporter outer membrane factor (OMF) lipoprotein